MDRRSRGSLREGAGGAEQNYEPRRVRCMGKLFQSSLQCDRPLCIGKSKPGGENTQRNGGDWKADGKKGKKQKCQNGHSIQLSRMLWEQAAPPHPSP